MGRLPNDAIVFIDLGGALMNAYIIEQLIETGLLVVLCLCFVAIMTISVHDIIRTTRHRRLPKVLRDQPHITVLVYACNDAATIKECLTSILHSSYRHFDVVMIDDRSSDRTYKKARLFQDAIHKENLILYKRRKVSSQQIVLRDAYKRSKRGDVVLVLSGSMVISKVFLRECAGEYATYPVDSIKLNTHYEVGTNLQAVVPRIQQLARHLQLKVSTIVSLGSKSELGVLYKREVFLRKYQKRHEYRGNLIVGLVRSPKIEQERSFVSAGITAGLLVLGTYALYSAIATHDGVLLIFSWLIVTLWLLAAVWLDEAEKLGGKLKLTFSVPPLYFVMYSRQVIKILLWPIKTFFNRG